jgi:hypothetical protein
MQARDAPSDARMERGVEILPPTEETVHQLLSPAPVSRVESGGAPVVGRIEERAIPQIGEHVRRGEARVRNAGMQDGISADKHALKIGMGIRHRHHNVPSPSHFQYRRPPRRPCAQSAKRAASAGHA